MDSIIVAYLENKQNDINYMYLWGLSLFLLETPTYKPMKKIRERTRWGSYMVHKKNKNKYYPNGTL